MYLPEVLGCIDVPLVAAWGELSSFGIFGGVHSCPDPTRQFNGHDIDQTSTSLSLSPDRGRNHVEACPSLSISH